MTQNNMRVEMVNPQRVILEEIAAPQFTRDSVALTYAFCLRQSFGGADIDFRTINRAILDRWSPSALDHIKARAWGLYFGRSAP